jgi:hypothetical protein
MKQYSTYINNFDNALSRMQAWDATSAPMIKGGSNVASLAALSVSGAAGSVGMSPSLTDGVPHSGSKMNTSQTKRVKAFLKAAKKHPLHSQINLESYLLLPVQRVPRYKLLLEELAMCTPPLADSPRDTLDDALNEIASLASLMNEEKRDAESRLRLFYWQKRIASKGPSPLVQPHRKLIMDGSLQLIRLVKKVSSYVEVDNTILGDGDATVMPSRAVIPVESIKIEPMNRNLIILLCSDLLVLAQPRVAEGQEGQVDLYHVMRMSTLKEPASANGNVLRVVDHKVSAYRIVKGARLIRRRFIISSGRARTMRCSGVAPSIRLTAGRPCTRECKQGCKDMETHFGRMCIHHGMRLRTRHDMNINKQKFGRHGRLYDDRQMPHAHARI